VFCYKTLAGRNLKLFRVRVTSRLKLAYNQGMLEIMVPLPEHEYFKDAIGDLNLALELAIEYECFGSTTWRRQRRMGVQNLITAFTSKPTGSWKIGH